MVFVHFLVCAHLDFHMPKNYVCHLTSHFLRVKMRVLALKFHGFALFDPLLLPLPPVSSMETFQSRRSTSHGIFMRHLWQGPKFWKQCFTLTGKDSSSLEPKYPACEDLGCRFHKAPKCLHLLPQGWQSYPLIRTKLVSKFFKESGSRKLELFLFLSLVSPNQIQLHRYVARVSSFLLPIEHDLLPRQKSTAKHPR